MNTRDERILSRVKKHYDYICEKYGSEHILGVFLYGSQNYCFDNPDSDIDTKAIYIPDIDELVDLRQPLSKELHYEDEHIEIKDIREMCKMWKKQSMNFLEILFTPYCIINPLYAATFERWFLGIREDIVDYDVIKMIDAIVGQIKGTVRGINSENKDKGKKIANCLRLISFLKRFLDKGEPYEKAMIVPEENKKEFYEIKYHFEKILNTENDVVSDCVNFIEKECEIINKNKMLYENSEKRQDFVNRCFIEGTKRLIMSLNYLEFKR